MSGPRRGDDATANSCVVDLGPDPEWESTLVRLGESAARVAGAAKAALAIVPLVADLPVPGSGQTARLWSALASLGAADLTAARVVEPHLDALAILAEARADGVLPEGAAVPSGSGGTWGVYAAEGPGVRLEARRQAGQWVLSGRKPWCSLAGLIDSALITAWLENGDRALFAVDLRHPGVRVVDQLWPARGLTSVVSGPIDLVDVPATAIGPPGWYLRRPGFAWGGIGVAAVWFGAACAVARRLLDVSTTRPPDQVARVHLGAVDRDLQSARRALAAAAAAIDGHAVSDPAGLAVLVRSTVAGVCENVLHHVGHATGPAPLTLEADHSRRVADLQVYVRQWHAERDLAVLGDYVLSRLASQPSRGPGWPW